MFDFDPTILLFTVQAYAPLFEIQTCSFSLQIWQIEADWSLVDFVRWITSPWQLRRSGYHPLTTQSLSFSSCWVILLPMSNVVKFNFLKQCSFLWYLTWIPIVSYPSMPISSHPRLSRCIMCQFYDIYNQGSLLMFK